MLRDSQLWKSVFRRPAPRDWRGRALAVLSTFFLHLHPVSMRRHAVRPGYTWYLGAIAFFLFVFEAITGVLLMFYYRPTAEWAYHDMLALRDTVSFGVVREMHRWAAHAMVIVVWLHLHRVFLTGSYKRPREFNWVIGVGLLVLTLLLAFTGYLLPWDQLSMWAVTVSSNMAGATPLVGHEGPGSQLLTSGGVELVTQGSDARFFILGARTVGEETLNRFYVLHCVALPLASAVLIGLHFWRIRKDGGLSRPEEAGDAGLGVQREAGGEGGGAVSPAGRLALARRLGWAATWLGVAGVWAWLAVRAYQGQPVGWSEGVKRAIDAATGPVTLTLGWFALLVVLFLGRTFFVKPAVAWLGLNAAALALGLSMADPRFASIVGRPDNVPIVAMIFLLGLFTWRSAARAVENDRRFAQGLPPIEAEQSKEKILVWPEVIYRELIGVVFATAVLIVWSLVLRAPLEGPANPAVTPNPSKAPWYFVGLQEMLVYFDPWMAGVVLPALIVFGLAAIPYLDVGSESSGYSSISRRRPAYVIFQFGFLQLWILLILIGTFLRGPNWECFGPFVAPDASHVTAASQITATSQATLAERFWVDALGRPMPAASPDAGRFATFGTVLWRESPGVAFLLIYYVGVPILLARTVFRRARRVMGRARYAIMAFLLLTMFLLPLKMLLRWTLEVSYLVSLPEWLLNL